MRPRQPAGRAGLWTRASWWKRRTPGSVCWWCRPPPSPRPPPHRTWSGRCRLHDTKHVESGTAVWDPERSGGWTGRVIRRWASLPCSGSGLSVCSFQDSVGISFWIPGQRRTACPPCRCVFMPQLAADAAVQRKLGPQRCACQDCGGGHNLLNPHIRRFSSGPHKLPLHLPLCHDVDAMSDCSPWTTLSNFNVPHYFSGAHLRRSKRYRRQNISFRNGQNLPLWSK